MDEVAFWIILGCVVCAPGIFGAVSLFSDGRAKMIEYELQARELDIREKEINCAK